MWVILDGVLAMKTQSLSKIVCHSGTLVSILLRNSKPWKSVVLGTQLKIQNIPYPCYAERDQRERARFML